MDMPNSPSSPPSTDAAFIGDSSGSIGTAKAAAVPVATASTTSAESNNTNKRELRKLSHALAWLLRHKANEFHLPVSDDGYVPVEACLSCPHPKFSGPKWTFDDVRAVVETNDKKRFKLDLRRASAFYPNTGTAISSKHDTDGAGDGDDHDGARDNSHRRKILCIRANQGHSMSRIDPDQLLTRLTPEELAAIPIIVHGTYRDVWMKHIQTEGLKCMGRNHMHFATGVPTKGAGGIGSKPVVSGMRKSCQVHVYINSTKCAQDDIIFFRSDNGVLLTAGINGTLPTEYFSHVTTADGKILADLRSSPTSDGSTGKEDVTANSEL